MGRGGVWGGALGFREGTNLQLVGKWCNFSLSKIPCLCPKDLLADAQNSPSRGAAATRPDRATDAGQHSRWNKSSLWGV